MDRHTHTHTHEKSLTYWCQSTHDLWTPAPHRAFHSSLISVTVEYLHARWVVGLIPRLSEKWPGNFHEFKLWCNVYNTCSSCSISFRQWISVRVMLMIFPSVRMRLSCSHLLLKFSGSCCAGCLHWAIAIEMKWTWLWRLNPRPGLAMGLCLLFSSAMYLNNRMYIWMCKTGITCPWT